tara:strand:- start:6 stop:173 length:168 start_codon:yes stop_codon:yes gene_type:complete
MSYTYKKTKGLDGNEITNHIVRKEDNASIPFDEANTDYQEYLAWVAEGNTAEEAD